ncbi:MAG: ribonuclease domain-containing protein [Chitinophagaceae bacterium]
MRKLFRQSPLWLLLILLGIGFLLRNSKGSNVNTPTNVATETSAETVVKSTDTPSIHEESKHKFPDYVLKTLDYIREHQQAPDGYVGGRIFQNREKQLPTKTTNGLRIKYQEWDVHPQRAGTNRGPERLVTGDDGSAWYTADHYRSFTFIGAP